MSPTTITPPAPIRRDRIPDVRASVDLIALVERYAGACKPDGPRLRWVCPRPDHADTDPSFVVYHRKRPPDFFCYGCGWGGDVIEFVRVMEGITRREAIERLAARLNLTCDLPRDTTRPIPNREKPRHRPPYTTGELDAYVQTCHAALTAPAVLEHVAALGVLINGFPDAAIVSAPPTVLAWSYLLQRGRGGSPGRWPKTGSCRRWIRSRGMRTSPPAATATGSKDTSQQSLRPG
jgi:hypothetical protein